MKKKYTYLFWLLLIGSTIARLFYIGWGNLDLAPDEAHYWDWSRHLGLSYYSKGPAIAYIIFLGTHIGNLLRINPPNPAFWVRFSAIFNSLFIGIILWFITKRLWHSPKISFYALLITIAAPIFALGSILITVDNPLILYWILFIYLFILALETRRPLYWYLSGIVFGLGFLSKYTMIAILFSVIIYLALSREHRFWLRRKEFFLFLIIASLCSIPVILWNYNHNWIGFRHLQGQAGLSRANLVKSFFSKETLLQLGEFSGIQSAVISPGLFIIICWSFIKAQQIYRKTRDYKYNFLFWTGAPLLIFYLILSLHKPCQANWPIAGYLSGIILAAVFFAEGRKNNFLWISIYTGLALLLTVFALDILPIIGIQVPPRIEPFRRVIGWRKLGKQVGKIKDKLEKKGSLFIFSTSYQITSELAFYTPGRPIVYCGRIKRRMNQYDLWDDFSKFAGYNAIYVKDADSIMDPSIAAMFQSWVKLPLVKIWRGTEIMHQYTIFICYRFKGGRENSGYAVSY